MNKGIAIYVANYCFLMLIALHVHKAKHAAVSYIAKLATYMIKCKQNKWQ